MNYSFYNYDEENRNYKIIDTINYDQSISPYSKVDIESNVDQEDFISNNFIQRQNPRDLRIHPIGETNIRVNNIRNREHETSNNNLIRKRNRRPKDLEVKHTIKLFFETEGFFTNEKEEEKIEVARQYLLLYKSLYDKTKPFDLKEFRKVITNKQKIMEYINSKIKKESQKTYKTNLLKFYRWKKDQFEIYDLNQIVGSKDSCDSNNENSSKNVISCLPSNDSPINYETNDNQIIHQMPYMSPHSERNSENNILFDLLGKGFNLVSSLIEINPNLMKNVPTLLKIGKEVKDTLSVYKHQSSQYVNTCGKEVTKSFNFKKNYIDDIPQGQKGICGWTKGVIQNGRIFVCGSDDCEKIIKEKLKLDNFIGY